MTQRCPHCRMPIKCTATISIQVLPQRDINRRNREIARLKKKNPGMTVRDIAEEVGCSFATVSRILRETAE